MQITHTEDIDAFFDAILSLESREECYRFFEDALTVREVEDISQRLKAARMLKEGSSYNEVCSVTGMSTTTVSRVSKALEQGAGGYDMVMTRLDSKNKD